jgi:hypothetical protein
LQRQVTGRIRVIEEETVRLREQLAVAERRVDRATKRLDCLKLTTSPPAGMPPQKAGMYFGGREHPEKVPGATDWLEPMAFMVGQADGTGSPASDAGIHNFYRKISIEARLDSSGNCEP